MGNLSRRSYLFLDESGSSGAAPTNDPLGSYLALFGCIVSHDDYVGSLKPSLETIKRRHFPTKPEIVFHRADIIRKRGPFAKLLDIAAEIEFNEDMLEFYRSQPYAAIAVVVDKDAHSRRPAKSWGPSRLMTARGSSRARESARGDRGAASAINESGQGWERQWL